MLRYPDDWPKLDRAAWWWSWVSPGRAAALRRLAKAWRKEDAIQWACT